MRAGRLLIGFLATAALVACLPPTVSDIIGDRGPGATATPPDGRHHPVGWAASTEHGPAALFVQEDCRGCHGTNLEGASAVGCDSCHPTGWRENCTFCHGGTDNTSGAPPQDITGAVVADDLIFKSHTKHVDSTVVTMPFNCTQCHGATIPTNAMDDGHWFDDTPGRAEVDFSAGISNLGQYDYANGRCTNMWCHGNGRASNGVANYSDGPKGCTGCHPGPTSSATQISTMSGDHRRHVIGEAARCSECHSNVVAANNTITNPALHINKNAENQFAGTNMTYNGTTCNGTCHNDTHNGDTW